MATLKILLLTIVVFIAGSLWFSKLFGKTWKKIHHEKEKTSDEKKNDMKDMWKFMTAEFVLTFIINILLYFIVIASDDNLSVALITTLLLWFGLILPTTVSNVIWGGDDKKWMVKKIAISSGHRLITMLFAVLILFFW